MDHSTNRRLGRLCGLIAAIAASASLVAAGIPASVAAPADPLTSLEEWLTPDPFASPTATLPTPGGTWWYDSFNSTQMHITTDGTITNPVPYLGFDVGDQWGYYWRSDYVGDLIGDDDLSLDRWAPDGSVIEYGPYSGSVITLVVAPTGDLWATTDAATIIHGTITATGLVGDTEQPVSDLAWDARYDTSGSYLGMTNNWPGAGTFVYVPAGGAAIEVPLVVDPWGNGVYPTNSGTAWYSAYGIGSTFGYFDGVSGTEFPGCAGGSLSFGVALANNDFWFGCQNGPNIDFQVMDPSGATSAVVHSDALMGLDILRDQANYPCCAVGANENRIPRFSDGSALAFGIRGDGTQYPMFFNLDGTITMPATTGDVNYGWSGQSTPDDNFWLTYSKPGEWGVVRLGPGGAYTEFPVTSPGITAGVVAGPDGNIWFWGDTYIGTIDSGSTQVFTWPQPAAIVLNMVVGHDDEFWVATEIPGDAPVGTSLGIASGETIGSLAAQDAIGRFVIVPAPTAQPTTTTNPTTNTTTSIVTNPSTSTIAATGSRTGPSVAYGCSALVLGGLALELSRPRRGAARLEIRRRR